MVLTLQDSTQSIAYRAGQRFRSVTKGGRIGEPLDPSQVPRIFKAMACRAGLPAELVDGLSGHSTRVGAAQGMVAAGIGLPAILQAGRWKSPAIVGRYAGRLLARNGAAAQFARIQGRGVWQRRASLVCPKLLCFI